jgi:anaerobic ribonucleoside-triphosphate reductase
VSFCYYKNTHKEGIGVSVAYVYFNLPEEVQKRDGHMAKFDQSRIESAIMRAFQATKETKGVCNLASAVHEVCDTVLSNLLGATPSVEEIQNLVEQSLMQHGWWRTAKAYILYREQRNQIREVRTLVSTNLIDQYLSETDWRVNENANVGYSLQGLNVYLTGAMSAEYWLKKIYPQEVRDAHKNGDLHLHDLGSLCSYCSGWDLQALLYEGFNGVPGHTESAPPKHFRSALGQIYNFLYTCQNEAAGAQAFSSLDTLLAPYVAEDKLSFKEILQGLQETVFNLNTPTRVGGQTPFTNVTLDVFSSAYDTEPAVVGGKIMPYTYGDLQKERAMIAKAFCQVLLQGDAQGRGFTFPVPTFNITQEWEHEDMTEVWELTAKYGSPYFANFINSDLKPEDVRSMCCRLRLNKKELLRRGGGLFGADPMTGSIGVVTLNLPRIAYLAKDKKEFFSCLAHLASTAVTALEVKRKALDRFAESGLYPFTMRWLYPVKERFGSCFANHFSTIGIVGGNEACLNLLGVSITHPEGKAFMEETLYFLRDLCARTQERTGNLYNLEATPAEGCSHRLAKLDKDKYPEIIVANEDDWKQGTAPYYTNSSHAPVGWTDDPFELLEHQETLQSLYTGGTVLHFWTGEAKPDPQACRNFVLTTCQVSRLPYLTITPTYSICPKHGYIVGEHPTCPDCGNTCEVWSRVTGYYRPVAGYNPGKKAEFADRKSFRQVGGSQ